MEHCPLCGAALPGGAVSLCPACGSQIQASGKNIHEDNSKSSGRKKHKVRKRRKGRDRSEPPCLTADDAYDGYYDDVLPPDWDQVHDGIDKELIRRVIFLLLGVSAIILMCVALLFFL